MLTVERVLILNSVPLFSSVPEEHLVSLAEAVEEIEVAEGESVIRKGEMGSAMYVVVRGQLRVHDESGDIRLLGERAVFGELAALDPEPRSASVTACVPTVLLEIERELLYELMSEDERFTRGILHRLCTLIRQAPNVPASKSGEERPIPA